MELYILSVLHGGKIEADPMAKIVPLQNVLKLFKKRVRRIAMHCIEKREEWHFET